MDTMTTPDPTRLSLSTPTAYTMTGFSQTPSRNGVAWSGVIRLNGVEVGRCTDAGVGGMMDFEWTSTQHMDAFRAEAEARYGDHIEADADFANDLATAAEFNRKRSVVFITDDQDLSMGQVLSPKAGVTLAQVKAALTAPGNRYAGKNPMIWDKTQSIFVPAADIVA